MMKWTILQNNYKTNKGKRIDEQTLIENGGFNHEAYTLLYFFEDLPKKVKINEKTIKEYDLIFDRLTFDIDREYDENETEEMASNRLNTAYEQALNLKQWFNTNFEDLYSELWFSGGKGFHLYVYFQPIQVKNPKEIVKRITKTLKKDISLLDTAITDIYTRRIRAKNSLHSNGKYYKVNVDKLEDINEVLIQARTKPRRIIEPVFNESKPFTDWIKHIDESISNPTDYVHDARYTVDDEQTESLLTALKHVFKEGQRDTVTWALIHCFKRSGKTKDEVKDFFSNLELGDFENELQTKINLTYDCDDKHLAGLKKVNELWREVGASEDDLKALNSYFSIGNSQYFPYNKPKANIFNKAVFDDWLIYTNENGNLKLLNEDEQDQKQVIENGGEEYELMAMFKPKNLFVLLDKYNTYTVNDFKDGEFVQIGRSFEWKGRKDWFFKETGIPTKAFEMLYNAINVVELSEYNRLKMLLSKSTSNAEDHIVEQLIAQYFDAIKGYQSPKGAIVMHTDLIGRFKTTEDLIGILKDEFKPQFLVKPRLVKEAVTYLHRIEPTTNMLKVANGFYDFNKMCFFEKAEDEIVILKESPYRYDSTLIGEPMPDLLKGLFNNLVNQSVESLLTAMGYMLTDGNAEKIILLLIGEESDCGKSTIAKIIGALLDDKVCSIDPFNINDRSIELVENNLNIYSEFPDTRQFAMSMFKQYTGNDPMRLRALYTQGATIDPIYICKTVLTTNNMNGIAHRFDKSLFTRFSVFFEFKRKQKKNDPQLYDKIISDEHTMNWLLTNSIHEYSKDTRLTTCKHTDMEVAQMVSRMDDPLENALIEKYTYSDSKTTYLEDGSEVYINDREFLLEWCPPVSELKQLVKKYGKDPKHTKKYVEHAFDVKHLKTEEIRGTFIDKNTGKKHKTTRTYYLGISYNQIEDE